jgi:hypothetical protein
MTNLRDFKGVVDELIDLGVGMGRLEYCELFSWSFSGGGDLNI